MWSGLGALLFSKFINGAVNPAVIKLAIREFPPVLFIVLRFTFSLLLFAPFYFYQRKKLQFADIKKLSLTSLFFCGHVFFYSFGIAFTTIIMSEIIYAALPVFVVIICFTMGIERLTRQKAIGFLIAFS